MAHLPIDAQERKQVPIASGLLDYFPDALIRVAELSYVANKQHNGDEPLFWNRSKSKDHADALMRHFLERGTVDSDGIRHSTKVAWRALANLQEELEKAGEGSFPRNARYTFEDNVKVARDLFGNVWDANHPWWHATMEQAP